MSELAYSLHLGSDKNRKNVSRARAKSNTSGTTSLSNNAIQNARQLSRVDKHNYRKYDDKPHLIEIVRGTPMLLQILIMYAGSKMFFGIDLSPFTSAIIAIALNSAAYVSEIVRAGIEAVDKGQSEAARSIGMNSVQTMLYIVLPQAIKTTLLASIIF